MIPAASAHPEPEVRAGGVLRLLDAFFVRMERGTAVLPATWNPLAQTGAVANLSFLVACASGILLLFWYSASVHEAWQSVQAMAQRPLTAGLIRTVHRVSSDLAIVFAALHGLRLLAARRFGGARWLAWVTGVLLLGTLWLVGWLGYWLVWDQRAQLVAVGTARMLDEIPIFVDPISRSFLTNEGVNSLLFFVVFFLHMLIPLAMGVLVWLHITRLSRARFLPGRRLSGVAVGTMIAIALLFPAGSAPAADLTAPPASLTIDPWFLLPLALTERLGGVLLWFLVIAGGAVALSIPWLLTRRRAQVAVVDTARCNGCTLCAQDCPYDAVHMVPRSDGRGYAVEARVDPDRCVGCGICAGSCDPGGISLPWLPVVDQRKRIEAWIEDAIASGDRPHLAFVCASSAGASLQIDEETGRCPELPGYRVLPVPCTGWVQRFTLERAIRKGAAGALVVGCGPVEPSYREGGTWTAARIAGERRPALRRDKVEADRIHFLQLDRSGKDRLLRSAAAFRQGRAPAAARGRLAGPAAAAAVAACAALLVGPGGDVALAGPPPATELVISFQHPGRSGESCRPVTEEEKARMPAHMQLQEICERGRAPVRLQVAIDGEVRIEKAYEPRGWSRDGTSVGIEVLELAPGLHEVAVAIGETADPQEWTHATRRRIDFPSGARRVLLFDRTAGFTWHGPAGVAADATHARR